MEDFVKRIIKEQNEVTDFYDLSYGRLLKLDEFLKTDKFKELSYRERNWLLQQDGYMEDMIIELKNYLDILTSRVSYYMGKEN